MHGYQAKYQAIIYASIMLALCLMLSKTYYAQHYAGIIGLGLVKCQPHLFSIGVIATLHQWCDNVHFIFYSHALVRYLDTFLGSHNFPHMNPYYCTY